MNRLLPLAVLLTFVTTATTAFGEDTLLTATDDASFHVRNRKFGDLLRPRDASNRDGTPIVLYPIQPWKCMIWQFNQAETNSFWLKNRFTAKSLGAATATGDPLVPVLQVPCASDAHDAPAWVFSKLADGAYRIGQPGNNMVLTAEEYSRAGVRVVLAPWRDADEQKWELIKAPENPTM